MIPLVKIFMRSDYITLMEEVNQFLRELDKVKHIESVTTSISSAYNDNKDDLYHTIVVTITFTTKITDIFTIEELQYIKTVLGYAYTVDIVSPLGELIEDSYQVHEDVTQRLNTMLQGN